MNRGNAPTPKWWASVRGPTLFLTFPFEPSEDWEQLVLLRSDAHHDSAHADHAIERRHLDQAVEHGAAVLDFGDLFDAMQCPHDRRADRRDARPEDNDPKTAYLNGLLSHAEEFYRPYADHLVMLATGNHETAVTKHTGLDLTRELVRRLRPNPSSVPFRAGYEGYIQFGFRDLTSTKRARPEVASPAHTVLGYFSHGRGGNAPVTRGVIDTARDSVNRPDPDIMIAGHKHTSYCMPIPRERWANGVVSLREQLHLRIPGYKLGHGEWAQQKGFAPPNVHGAWWLRFAWRDGLINYDVRREI